MCEGCPYADLELYHIERIDGTKMWSVKCLHRDACDWQEAVTAKRLQNTDKKKNNFRG